jgi:hypothetical protein
MTELLEKAFARAAELPQQEQDALAQWILEVIEEDRQWDETFANSADVLAQLADDALAEYRAGRTQKLDPDQL